MKYLLVLLILCAACLPGLAAADVDSLVGAQRERAGSLAPRLFAALDSARSVHEREDAAFLLAYMPLGDLATVQAAELLENVRLAREARERFSWAPQLSDELYRHFILPHRVSQEPYVHGWRARFLNEITPRVRDLSMTEAALEVNHWCHEYVTYKASDGRDQDPLTTMRAGLGRCEEEMIFTICALRSVGIPARQCYTPYWAHTDDNHAWVEVWADGQWHYYGACEPEPVLDRGWFTDAAARAMLVVSTAYGDYHGSEPVLRRYGSSTLINSTAVYGRTRELVVRVKDDRGKPMPGTKVLFNLFNYGMVIPAMAMEADSAGWVTLVCGAGDWFVSAGRAGESILAHAPASATDLELQLGPLAKLSRLTQADYAPPPVLPASKGVEQDSLFKRRLAYEDSLREARLWSAWATEANLDPATYVSAPDTAAIHQMAATLGVDSAGLVEILRGARGNWGTLYRFLTGSFPGAPASRDVAEVSSRFLLLKTLSDKDRRDFSHDVLEDHYRYTVMSRPLPALAAGLAGADSSARERIEECVIAPRIANEPSMTWRQRVHEPFAISSHSEFATSLHDSLLIRWLLSAIKVDSTRDRLGPPLTPAQVLELRRGTKDDVNRLYIALCRVRGIPARLSPVTSRPEKWEGERWQEIALWPETPAAKETSAGTGTLTVDAGSDTLSQNALYFQRWGVQRWQDDHFEEIDFGFHTAYRDMTWPQELPVGLYCLTTGVRKPDGSAPVAFRWFEIRPGEQARVPLQFRD